MRLRIEGDAHAQGAELRKGLAQCSDFSLIERARDPRDVYIYLPAPITLGMGKVSADALTTLFTRVLEVGTPWVVLLSSSEVHQARPAHPGMVGEIAPISRGNDPVSGYWQTHERVARQVFEAKGVSLTIMRLAPVPLSDGLDFYSSLLRGKLAVTFPGFDPNLQFLEVADMVNAVAEVLVEKKLGVVNVAPGGTIPLKSTLTRVGKLRLPLPWWLQFLARKVLAPLGLAWPIQQMERIRYPFTISGQGGRSSSDKALCILKGKPEEETHQYDDYGFSKGYVKYQMGTQLGFLHNWYWRVAYEGLDHIPEKGRAVLLGVHRGFMPYDGTMILYAVQRALGRYPRFLIHPSLVKPPILANFISKLGGLVACRQNAAYVLENDHLLGLFPEGIDGAFRFYKDAYTLGNFARDEYIKIALRHSAPIVPFVTVGSAEIYPILGRIDLGWWRRYSGWPFLPITPTFPLAPIPLPSKWHTQVLPPIAINEQYPPEAADDPKLVAEIGRDIKQQMQTALTKLKQRRKSIFWGSIFNQVDPKNKSDK